jgi:taurine dioxygenase
MTDLVIRPLADRFAAEITGIDTSAPLAPAVRDGIVEAFHRYQALVVRGPVLSPRQFVTFVRSFGEPDPSDTSRYHAPIDIDGFKGLRLVSNIEEGGRNKGQFGNDEMGWHQDRWTDAAPPPATMLHGVEITRGGGRTGVVSLCDAWDMLPDDLKARIEGRSIHFPLLVTDTEGRLATADPNDESLFRIVPLVQVHAVTGRKYLFLGARRILSYIDTAPLVSGLSREESAALLDAIYAHISRPELSYLHQWQAGDILFWDNRCCAHRRESFDAAERRLLYAAPLVHSDLLWHGQVPQAA